jgi:tetratricopeptide (TPR) repeat protein
MAEPLVFISYTRHDNDTSDGFIRAFAPVLADEVRRLRGRKIEVFLDQDALRPGEDWNRALETAIRRCEVFIAFDSPNYVRSPICRQELNLGLEVERERGREGLVMRLLFVTDEFANSTEDDEDEVRKAARELDARHRLDFTDLNHQEAAGPVARPKIQELARYIAEWLQAVPAGTRVRPPSSSRAAYPLPDFVPDSVLGRGETLERLAALLDRPGVVIAALVGAQGIGKTAVATRFARHRGADATPVYLAARGYPGVNSASVLKALAVAHPEPAQGKELARRMRDPESGIVQKIRALLAGLAGHRVLLILDDAEQLLDASAGWRDEALAGLLGELVRLESQSVQVLLVSDRKPWMLADNFVELVTGLDDDDDLEAFLSALTPDGQESMRVPARQWSRFTRRTRRWPRPAELVHGVVAGRSLTLTDVLDEMGTGRKVIDVAVAGLTGAERGVVRVLAAIGRPIPVDVVDALAGRDADNDRVLTGLANRRIVRRQSPGGRSDDLFYLPAGEAQDLAMAEAATGNPGELTTLRRRAAEHFENEARAADRDMRELGDLGHYLDAVDLFLECGEHRRAFDLAVYINERFLKGWGQTAVLFVPLRRLAAEMTGEYVIAAQSLIAWAQLQQGRPRDAIATIEAAGGRTRSEMNQLILLNQLGSAQLADGRLSTALETFTEVIELARPGPGFLSRAETWFHLANFELELGRFDEAEAHVGRAHEDLRNWSNEDHNDQRLTARLARTEGLIHLERGDYRTAGQRAEEARQVAGEVFAEVLAAECDDLSAWASLLDGKPEEALEFARQSFVTASRTGSRGLGWTAATTLAVVHLRLREPAKAYVAAREAVRWSYRRTNAGTWAVCGIAALRAGQGKPARDSFRRTLGQIAETFGERRVGYEVLEAKALAEAGLALIDTDHYMESRAAATFTAAIEMCQGAAGARARRRLMFGQLVAIAGRETLPEVRAVVEGS